MADCLIRVRSYNDSQNPGEGGDTRAKDRCVHENALGAYR